MLDSSKTKLENNKDGVPSNRKISKDILQSEDRPLSDRILEYLQTTPASI